MFEFVREKTVSFSGHRTINVSSELIIKLKKAISAEIIKGADTFLIGMAKGFDILAGELLIDFKKNHNIKIVAIVPCDFQTSKFSEVDKIRYRNILKECFEVIQTGKTYNSYNMRKRNKFLVDNSSVLISYLNKDKTGTSFTVSYGYKSGIKIINLA